MEDDDFTAGLRNGGLVTPWVLDGPMDGDAFRVYVQEVLAPELVTGDVVIMDNLPAHKVKGVRQTIEAAVDDPTVAETTAGMPGSSHARCLLRISGA